MKVIMPVSSRSPDEELAIIRGFGVTHAELYLSRDEIDTESLSKIVARLKGYNIKVEIISCLDLQKNKKIDLGLDGRDEEIEDFKKLVISASANDIHALSVAWQPNGILRTGRAVGEHTRGCVSGYVDMQEIEKRGILNDREYSCEEMWETFQYFLEKVSPTCKEHHVRIALHPSDPPVRTLGGVGSLLYNTDDFHRAFALDKDQVLGMKLCMGCWLEGGDTFGNLLQDIEDFNKENRILCVHFRNVSATLPYFEETLAEDGYGNMYELMKKLVAVGYQETISVDHVFDGHGTSGGAMTQWGYATGYMKGLMHAAEAEFAAKQK